MDHLRFTVNSQPKIGPNGCRTAPEGECRQRAVADEQQAGVDGPHTLSTSERVPGLGRQVDVPEEISLLVSQILFGPPESGRSGWLVASSTDRTARVRRCPGFWYRARS